MDTTTIIMIIALVLLILTNIAMIVLNIYKKKNSGEITMNTEDYLTLILQQLDQIAQDALDIAKLKAEDFATENEYHLAILKIAKERLFECGEEYGLSPSVIKLIDTMKLDQYLLDSIDVATRKEELADTLKAATSDIEDNEEVAEVSSLENDEFTDAASEEISNEEAGVQDIGDAITSVYDENE